MNLTAPEANHILSSVGLRMPPFSADLDDQRLRKLCWRLLYAARGLCWPVHYESGRSYPSELPEPVWMEVSE